MLNNIARIRVQKYHHITSVNVVFNQPVSLLLTTGQSRRIRRGNGHMNRNKIRIYSGFFPLHFIKDEKVKKQRL